jgi:hypothetical protein
MPIKSETAEKEVKQMFIIKRYLKILKRNAVSAGKKYLKQPRKITGSNV